MKFQIVEKIKDDIEVPKNTDKYDIKIYIEDNPIRMVVEINDSCEWETKLISMVGRLRSRRRRILR